MRVYENPENFFSAKSEKTIITATQMLHMTKSNNKNYNNCMFCMCVFCKSSRVEQPTIITTAMKMTKNVLQKSKC